MKRAPIIVTYTTAVAAAWAIWATARPRAHRVQAEPTVSASPSKQAAPGPTMIVTPVPPRRTEPIDRPLQPAFVDRANSEDHDQELRSDKQTALGEEADVALQAYGEINREYALKQLEQQVEGDRQDSARSAMVLSEYENALRSHRAHAQVDVRCTGVLCRISANVSDDDAATVVERVAKPPDHEHVVHVSTNAAGAMNRVLIYRMHTKDLAHLGVERAEGVLAPPGAATPQPRAPTEPSALGAEP